ncbi:MAG: hypothetical protein JWO30_3152 [Fibrobacteres bacterium]|nr:hypothetical protein [Fibrobacterota bacterium]
MENRSNRILGVTVLAALAGAVILVSCRRDFDSPYMPGSPGYAGDDWTQDKDGNGVADSIEKYSPACKLPPDQCLENAKVIGRISGEPNTLSARDMLLWLGDTGQAPSLIWNPAEGSVRGYVLASSDSSTVRPKDGMLVPMTVGSAQVFVTVPGADSLVASFIVKVVSGGQRVVSVSATDLTVLVGKDTAPNVTWTPANPLYRDYSLTSDNPDVARITSGKIRGVFPGKAAISLEALDGGHKTVFTVTVLEGPAVVYTNSITAEDLYLVRNGPPADPILHWLPEMVTDKYFKLVSVDTNIVTILDRTQVVPKAAGNTQVYVIVLDGSRATADFNVSVATQAVPVQGIKAAPLSLVAGADPVPPKLTWLPSDATNRKFYLSSNDPNVALAQSGVIHPLSMGVAELVVITEDGGYQDTFSVTVGRPDTTNHVDSVKVQDFSMPTGSSRKPAISWFPADAGNQSFTLSSDDVSVVAVSGEMLTAVKVGSANVVLTTQDGARTASFKVTVYPSEIPVTMIAADSMSLTIGQDMFPSLTWTPSDATNLSYTLFSLDTSIATIVGTQVHAKAVGRVSVIVKSADDPSSVFQVVVNSSAVKLTGLIAQNFTMNVGDPDRDAAVGFLPSTATNKAVTLKSLSVTSVYSINANKVHALAPGKAPLTIVANENTGIAVTCTVTVVAMVKSVSAKDDTLRLGQPDKDASVLLTWEPPNATDKSFSLKSNDTNIVRTNGKAYKAIADGKTTVIVRALDGSGKADTFNVLVKVPVTGIVAKDYTMKTTDPDYSTTSLFTFSPANATDKNWYLNYTYPNASPAPSTLLTIVSGWQLRALSPGTVSLYVTANDNPAVKDTFTVTIIRPVTGISAAAITMKVGDADRDAIVTIAPGDASNKAYTLASGNTGVATVVGNKIHAAGGGSATFTAASTYDPSKTTTFTVTVSIPVISLSAPDIAMKVGDPVRDPVITWNPSGATNKGYSMASSNGSVVLITAANKLQAAGPGSATITLTASDGGKTAPFTVSVTQPVVSFSVADLTMKKTDADRDPVITWIPGNASNKGYSLSGGNAGVATVVGNRVHAVGGGKAIFYANSSDGGKIDTFTVTVEVPVEFLRAADISMRTSDPDQPPDLTWTPSDATNKGYILTSGDPGTVTITADGLLHAVSRGTATVTVKSAEDNAIVDHFSVQVR